MNDTTPEVAPRTRARLGSMEYSSMTRSMENLQIFDKFKLEHEKNITMIEDVKENGLRAVRKGIKDYRRPQVWRKILRIQEIDHDAKYKEIINQLFFKEVPKNVRQEVAVPDFGGVILLNSHVLPPKAQSDVSMLLCVLRSEFPEISYCPILPDSSAILIKYLTPAQTFCALSKLLKKDVFPTSGRDFRNMALVSKALAKKHAKRLIEHAGKLGVPIVDTFGVWTARLFTSFLPYTAVLRVMDCLLVEGTIVIHRVIVAVMKMYGKELLETKTMFQFQSELARLMRTKTNAGDLMTCAYGTKITPSQIHSMRFDSVLTDVPFDQVQVFSVPHFNKQRPSKLASTGELRRAWQWLPNLLRIEDPVVLHSSDHDGYNLGTMLDLIRDKQSHKEPIFILVKGSKMPPIGMFLDWSLKRGYLDENAFVFRLGESPRHWKLTNKKARGKCYKRLRTFIVAKVEAGDLCNEGGEMNSNDFEQEEVGDMSSSDSTLKSQTLTINYASENKTSREDKLKIVNASNWLKSSMRRESSTENADVKSPNHCQASARGYMFEALNSPEVKILFDNLDENQSGSLLEAQAKDFFGKFLRLVLHGTNFSEDKMERIIEMGTRKLMAHYTMGSPPELLWTSLMEPPCEETAKEAKEDTKGPWFFLDSSKGVGIGMGHHVALHIHKDLRYASSLKTDASPSLAPHSKDHIFEIVGIEIWGLTSM
ncbi:hypothetical protein AAMO2058_001008800 [Amorphochlora amoebiformis]|uniref:Rab-GAP TBC domain-containing protein n=1 Tax=Amorphochlora amoebiformis TaxID=1561963 RepID=A0A7S0CQM8_9EUKA|mmetsp:Transcript_1066/g.1486  ORF Transcript_1066/g.1486 Transcript_1066/m.1486 type:complete len:708 (+) Transcript_1066:84-2207(+)